MAPGSLEVSLQREEREERQLWEGETAWVLQTGWHSERLEVGWRVEDPLSEGARAGPLYQLLLLGSLAFQVAVLGQGCKGALWKSLCNPDRASLVGVWLGVKEGCLLVLSYKPRPWDF